MPATPNGESWLAYYSNTSRGEGFGNGRTARRTFETMVAEHANRLAGARTFM
jgi:AAA lid domain